MAGWMKERAGREEDMAAWEKLLAAWEKLMAGCECMMKEGRGGGVRRGGILAKTSRGSFFFILPSPK
jgi:hypothetical protein